MYIAFLLPLIVSCLIYYIFLYINIDGLGLRSVFKSKRDFLLHLIPLYGTFKSIHILVVKVAKEYKELN